MNNATEGLRALREMAPRRRQRVAFRLLPATALLAFVVAVSVWLKHHAVHRAAREHTQPQPGQHSHLHDLFRFSSSSVHSAAQQAAAVPSRPHPAGPATTSWPPPPVPAAEQPFYMNYEAAQCHTGMHVIFSTICMDFGDWQAEGLVFSHYASQMKGTITRIVSCSKPNYTYPQLWHPCYSIHVLPDLAEKTSTYNKAFAIRDWFENGDGRTLRAEDVVVLFDGDMILTQALDSPALVDHDLIMSVRPGKPLSQLYLLGSYWIIKEKPIMDAVQCGRPCEEIDRDTAGKHFQIGPPHFMAAADWRTVAPRWTQYTLAFWDRYKPNFPWEGDMFSFNMALLKEGIFHEQTYKLMVSSTGIGPRAEAWAAVGMDEPTTFASPSEAGVIPAGYNPGLTPQLAIIHYCQYYSLFKDGKQAERGYSFGKYDYKDQSGFIYSSKAKSILGCPPDTFDFYPLAATARQELWAAYELQGRALESKRINKRPEGEKAVFGGWQQAVPGGLNDRRRLFLIEQIPSWLNAAANNYRVRVCDAEHPLTRPAGAHVFVTDPDEAALRQSQVSLKAMITRDNTTPPPRPPPASPPSKVPVAVAITVCEDGPQGDGAAVLAKSVRDLYADHPMYDVQLLAIVSVTTVKMLPMLRRSGYRILQRDVPVRVDELENPVYRERAPTSGCCGLSELLKLEGWTLGEYEKVLLLDMDTVMVQRVDELWERDVPIVFTRPGGNTQEPLQGGMIMLQPNLDTYARMLAVIRKGDFQYNGRGWENSGIGYAYGGETVQGMVPFFFAKKMPEGSTFVPDECVYNNMGDSPRCREIDPARVKLFHFTVCQKPWYCLPGGGTCKWGQQFWWTKRNEIEAAAGLPASNYCSKKFDYRPIELPYNDASLFLRVQHGCKELPTGCAKF